MKRKRSNIYYKDSQMYKDSFKKLTNYIEGRPKMNDEFKSKKKPGESVAISG